jgi:hypothetical protein
MEHKINGTKAEQAIAKEMTRPWYRKVGYWLTIANILVLVLNVGVSAGLFPHAQVPNQALENKNGNLDLQNQCATQAQKTLEGSQKDTQGSLFSQQNHYNLALNKCFVLISYLPVGVSGKPTNYEQLFDAYENNLLSQCTYYANRVSADFSNPTSYTTCFIGNQTVPYQQYEDFVVSRMEMTQ